MTRKVHNIPDYEAIVREYYARALDIDAMPIDGTPHQRNTAFQARRREQVEFLQSIWQKFFPNSMPTSVEARDLIGTTGTNSVGDVLECLAYGAIYQHKGRGVIRRDREGKAQTVKIKGADGKLEDTGKIKRTKRKINNDIQYMKKVIWNLMRAGADKKAQEEDQTSPETPAAEKERSLDEIPSAELKKMSREKINALARVNTRSNGHTPKQKPDFNV